MTDKDMTDDFLNWEEPKRKPKLDEVPASQLNLTPTPHHEHRGAPTYVNPEQKEPTIQTPEVAYRDIEVPLAVAPTTPEMVFLDQLTEKYRDLFNGTVKQSKDFDAENLQKLRHSMIEKIEMVKVQLRAVTITYEGKLQLESEKVRKKLKEADSAFYIPRREKGAAKSSAPKSEKTTANAYEKAIQQMVRMKMDEATIRKVLKDSGTPIADNLTAIISQFQLKG